MQIDPKRTYRTRDGRDVRIYAVDGGGGMPVHGAVLERGEWRSECWSSSGEWAPQDCAATAYDLIEVRPRIKREVWVNVYDGGCSTQLFEDKSKADAWTAPDRIACVKLTIDVEEGHGLED